MYKTFLLAAWLLLLPLSAIAQGSDFVKPIDAAEAALDKFMINHIMQTAFEEDPSGVFMVVLVCAGESILPGFRNEFEITEEQVERLNKSLNEAGPENLHEMEQSLKAAMRDGNFEPTEDEEAAFQSIFKYIFEAANSAVADALTDEQIQKMDGMILALSGGLESPFFNDRHMTALDMTDEQKAKFKAITEATKLGRDKMITGVSEKIEQMFKTGKFNFKDIVAVLSQFKEFTGDLKKRRMEVLTAAQIAQAGQLAKLPKSFSVFNLLPQWVPNANSWQPGDPLPEGARPVVPAPGRFPRSDRE